MYAVLEHALEKKVCKKKTNILNPVHIKCQLESHIQLLI